MGFSDEILQSLKRYSAQRSAAHLLPYLRPGLRVLDFGCGPGTISVGLAEAISPAELHGVDMEETQIDQAKAIAMSQGLKNVQFSVADVTELPFEDEFFDVAHCHNVLMHVPDTLAVLSEVKRVLKPGGLIACREMICDSSFTHPDFGVISKAWGMFGDLLQADDGHPQMGRELKGHFLSAGFENVRTSNSFDIYGSPMDITFIHGLVKQWFLSPEIREAAIKYGAATPELCSQIDDAYDRWKDHPGAVCAVAFGQAVSNKP